MKQFLIIILILVSLCTFGQKISQAEADSDFVEMAKTELNSALTTPNSELFKKISESGITGHYVFDISLRGKGIVATVFVVNAGEQSISMQNRLKDIIKAYRFSLKVPKKKIYKFQYTFDL